MKTTDFKINDDTGGFFMAGNDAAGAGINNRCFRDAVCIDTAKIYDSCCDKEYPS